MKLKIYLPAQSAATLALALALTPYAGMRVVVGQTTAAARLERERREREERDSQSEFDLRMADELRKPEERRREPRPTFAQVREDYVRIQVVNNDLARVVAAPGALDLKAVASAAGEIKKRAGQLKTNLALPEPERDEKSPRASAADAEQLKASLASLDTLILRFVRSPVFTNPRRVDLAQSAAARRDLEEIIELSGQVKKVCERLSKAADKQQ